MANAIAAVCLSSAAGAQGNAAPTGSDSNPEASAAPASRPDQVVVVTVARGPLPATGREQPESAWWTGPLFAASANTLAKGHWLVEPYLFDLREGTSDSAGTSLFVVYGLTNRIALGFVEPYAMGSLRTGVKLSTGGWGDPTAQLQYRVNRPARFSSAPTVAVLVQQTIPTSRYDRLDGPEQDAHGAGAWTTRLAVYLQSYFWLSNGRILRVRLDVAQALADRVRLQGRSVYGTPASFDGAVRIGPSTDVDASLEYSLTQRWVLALEAIVRHSDAARVRGSVAETSIDFDKGPSDSVAVAPAIEYSWNARFGVVGGVRFRARGRDTSASIMPTVALNMVF